MNRVLVTMDPRRALMSVSPILYLTIIPRRWGPPVRPSIPYPVILFLCANHTQRHDSPTRCSEAGRPRRAPPPCGLAYF